MSWQEFVIRYCRYAPSHHVAAVVGQPPAAINKLRATGVCVRGPCRTFGDMFPLFHGRQPRDDEWPRPRRKANNGYEWQTPELALLARLNGTMAPLEICRVLTERLQTLTGDPTASRNRNALNTGLQRVGLVTSDVVGGITAQHAGRSIGCTSIVYNDIRQGRLKAGRVGRHLVIAHDEWARWKAARVFPPKGYVQISTLKRPLGITSDKLSEWARAGRVPTAIRCNPYGTRSASTKFGTWWIDPRIAKKLIADRRAGRPMPWWGKVDHSNVKVTYKLWLERQHPPHCETCRGIWGTAGAPRTFEDYLERYPPLAHGAKRHLTRVWFEGLSIVDVARQVGMSPANVAYAIRTGALHATLRGRKYVISRTDATRWKARKCPTGDSYRSWMSLAFATKVYGFTTRELHVCIRKGQLKSRVGTDGAARGLRYVLKAQLRHLREQLGYSEQDAARRLGITIARLRRLRGRADWRDDGRYTLDVITTIRKRLESASGLTIAAAARELGKSVAWVEREIAHGTARVLRTPYNEKRRYLSAPMMKRLRAAVRKPSDFRRWNREWLLVSDAGLLAGVSSTTIQRWADAGEIRVRIKSTFRRYHRRSVIARARRYWATENRWKRRNLPAWLQGEQEPAA